MTSIINASRRWRLARAQALVEYWSGKEVRWAELCSRAHNSFEREDLVRATGMKRYYQSRVKTLQALMDDHRDLKVCRQPHQTEPRQTCAQVVRTGEGAIISKLEKELAAAYAELNKQAGCIRGVFDREVWARAKAHANAVTD